MMPYANGILLDNTNNYGIMKTETVFRFTPADEDFGNSNISTTDTLDWIYSDNKFHNGDEQDDISSRSLKSIETVTPRPSESRSKVEIKGRGKKHKKQKDKLKKCLYKLFKKGKKGKNKHKKYMKPLVLGLLAAKSLIIGIALKTLAFISAKGLMMGFFSTILASALSLKGMFDHSHGWNRRDDTKTQVEIIQVPSKSDEHLYYDHYKRADRLPSKVAK